MPYGGVDGEAGVGDQRGRLDRADAEVVHGQPLVRAVGAEDLAEHPQLERATCWPTATATLRSMEGVWHKSAANVAFLPLAPLPAAAYGGPAAIRQAAKEWQR